MISEYKIWFKTTCAKNIKNLKEANTYSIIDSFCEEQNEHCGYYGDIESIAEASRGSVRSTKRIIKQLEEKGLIQKAVRKSELTGKEVYGYRTNRESLIRDEKKELELEKMTEKMNLTK